MNVYVVEDCKNSPGHIYGIFADRDAAVDYIEQINAEFESTDQVACVLLYPLWYGQQRFPTSTTTKENKRAKR